MRQNSEFQPLLTCIVPLYNTEKYIEQCIRSIYDQDIQVSDIEVIVIDDGSEDNSREIVSKLLKEFETLKLISNNGNKKQGAARNTGLKNALGKYIWFIDSDDYIKPNVLGILLNSMQEYDLDLIHFDAEIIAYKDIITNRVRYSLDTCSGTDLIFDKNLKWSLKCCSVCNLIVKKDYLLTNNLVFVEGVQYEDSDFSLQTMAYAEKVQHIDFAPYCYRQVENSCTHSKTDPVKLKYWVLLSLRYTNLIHQFIIDKRDIRFIKGLKELIDYESMLTFKALCGFTKDERNQFQSMISEINTRPLLKQLGIVKYTILIHQGLWETHFDIWEYNNCVKRFKNRLKKII